MHNWRRAAYASVVLLSLLILATVCPISFSSNDSAEGATKNPSPSSLTFTSTSSTTSASLDVTSNSGSTATSSTNASFSLSTNNATGYTVNIKVDTDGYSTLKKTDDNTKTINSITSSSTLANLPVNTWGLLPSKYNGTNNTTTYYPASSAGFTMDTTNSANTVANSYTIGLGLKADYNTPAGTYTNTTIVAEYVANPVTYAIYYYTNTTDTVAGMPATNPQVPASAFPGTTSTTVNLASAPTRTGYTFLGWCMGTSNSSNITVGTNGNADTCASSSTNQFTAGQSFGINATGSSPDLYYFYAMWQVNSYTVTISNTNTTSSSASITVPYGGSNTVTVTPASGYYLDSVSCPSGYTCTGYSTGESYTDQQTVTVTNNNTTSGGALSFVAETKLYMWDATFADCGAAMWDNRDGTERKYTTAEINGLCWMTQNLMLGSSSSVTLSKATTNITADTYFLPARGTSGTSVDGQYVWGNDTQCIDSSTTACAGYYSYVAATAGTNPSSGAASSDICPAGWRLPTQAEFTTLKNTYTTGATLTASPFLGVYAGYYENSSFVYGGWYGYYWSSTAYGSRYAYYLYLYFASSSAGVGNVNKSFGYSVRCVMKPTMQDATSASLAAAMPNNGDTTTLTDSRDGQEYTVAKLADGKYWMTSNLNLAGGTAISCTTSDCENYTIPTNQGWQSGGKLPASSTSGFSNDNYAYVYNSGSTTCGNNSPCYSYYSWDAATLGSGRSISTDNTNAPYSICPKGWKLPTTYNGTNSTTDFRSLMIALGGSSSVQTYNSSTSPTGATMYGKLTASPYNFLLAGYYRDSSFHLGGSGGGYWSATSGSSSTRARSLFFNSTNVDSADISNRRFGFSVRCVFGG